MNKPAYHPLWMYLAFFFMISFHIFVNVFSLNGYTTGEISNLYLVYFTPADFTFVIWSVIYILLFLWLLRFSLHKQILTKNSCIWFILSCILNILWLISWHYLLDGTAVIILVLHLWSAGKLYLIQRRQKTSIWWLTPLSIYAGWLIIALATNIIYFSVATLKVTVDTQLALSYIALSIIIFTGFVILFTLEDWRILAVFVWSFFGITVKNYQDHWILSIVTIILTIFFITVSILYFKQIYISRKEAAE